MFAASKTTKLFCENRILLRRWKSGQIEVEIKFRFDGTQENKIAQLAKFKKQQIFTDQYFDNTKYDLSKNDVWLRKRYTPTLALLISFRDTMYECKVPLIDSHKKTDQYKELTAPTDITQFLSSFPFSEPILIPNTTTLFDAFLKQINLVPVATITTTRKKYQYNEFSIDLDSTDLGYSVGEVEIVVDTPEQANEASDRILQFCKTLNLDTKGPIYGKVLHYIQVKSTDMKYSL